MQHRLPPAAHRPGDRDLRATVRAQAHAAAGDRIDDPYRARLRRLPDDVTAPPGPDPGVTRDFARTPGTPPPMAPHPAGCRTRRPARTSVGRPSHRTPVRR